MIGALALTITGVALATMTPEQLAALRPERKERPPAGPRKGSEKLAQVASGEALKASHEPGETEEKRRLPRRPRMRQRG